MLTLCVLYTFTVLFVDESRERLGAEPLAGRVRRDAGERARGGRRPAARDHAVGARGTAARAAHGGRVHGVRRALVPQDARRVPAHRRLRRALARAPDDPHSGTPSLLLCLSASLLLCLLPVALPDAVPSKLTNKLTSATRAHSDKIKHSKPSNKHN